MGHMMPRLGCGLGRVGGRQIHGLMWNDTSKFDLRQLPVAFEDIARAAARLDEGLDRTSLRRSHFLSAICGMDVHLKFELNLVTGSFKERGARNALLCLSEDEKVHGVVAASAGNHALALAWHGASLGIPVNVVMPTIAPLAKVEKCRMFGANVLLHGQNIADAKEKALSLPDFEKLTYINGFDDHEIIAGAGTLGLELLRDEPRLDAVVVPCGGAGMLAGVGLAVKTLNRDCQVYAVEAEACPSFQEALCASGPVATTTTSTLADGLAVPTVGSRAYAVAEAVTDAVSIIDEKQIALAILRLVEYEKVAVEGGGAAGLAALLPGGPLHEQLAGKRVAVPLCGGNIDTTVLGRVLERGLAADGRLSRFTATVSDRPGGVAELTKLVAAMGASIKDIYHERAWLQSAVDRVQVRCVVEVTNREHGEEVRKELGKHYPLVWNPSLGSLRESSQDSHFY